MATVLLIDDELAGSRSLECILSSKGHTVHLAESRVAAPCEADDDSNMP